MRFKMLSIYMVVAIMLVASLSFGAANGTAYNQPVNISEVKGPGHTYVMYYGRTQATVATDSVGTHYTKAMYMPELQTDNCYFNMVAYNSARGTEDCDVYVEYSYDRITWFVGANASGKIKDQLTTTMVSDTLNVATGVLDAHYITAPWMRLKFAYQTANPVGTYITWRLVCRKDPETLGLVAAVANKI